MRALIVTYHAIEQGTGPLRLHPADFERQLDALARSDATSVRVSELPGLLSGPARDGGPLVALTFDDGFASVLENAVPLLADYGFTATVFCVAGRLGRAPAWPGGRSAPSATLMDESGLREAVACGLEIGSHGWTHAPLSLLEDEPAIAREVGRSRDLLGELLGAEIESFAYPYGALPTPRARRAVERTYAVACTTRVAVADAGCDVHALPRVDAYYLRRPDVLRRIVAGQLDAYLAARRVASTVRRALRKDFAAR